jgi:CheY-like chemotaxis protein
VIRTLAATATLENAAMPAAAPTILLVDDEEAFRYSAGKALEEAGFTVSSAKDYIDALEVLQSEQPVDLLVTDIVMPAGIHGFALARMARMRRLGVKVLYVSAYDLPATEAIGKVLRKPITAEELVSEVRSALAS